MRTRILACLVALVAFCFVVVPRAAASEIDIDASVGATEYGGYPFDYANYLSPIYTFQPGDTINFGTITLYSWEQSFACCTYGVFEATVGASFGPLAPLPQIATVETCIALPGLGCNQLYMPPPTTITLVYTLPPGASQIQIAWAGDVNYVAATPLPPPWTMLLLGLTFLLGLLFVARRTKFDAMSSSYTVENAA